MKLTPKIILLLLIITFGVMSFYSIFQIEKAKINLSAEAEKTHTLLLSNTLGIFSKSLWELDKDISLRGMLPLFENGSILDIRVYDIRGNFFTGLQYSKAFEGKGGTIAPFGDIRNYKYLNVGSSFIGLPFNDSPSKMISPIENFVNEKHRMIASLWWRESEETSPKFLGHVVMQYTTESIIEQLDEQKRSFFILTFILSFSIMFLTYSFLEMQVISPIRKLMQSSLDVARGKYVHLNVKGHDEISKLTENFNFMVTKIEHNLNVIKGLSEASQEIVACKTLEEIASVYTRYAIQLLNVKKVEIWVASLSDASDSPKDLRRLSDNQVLDFQNPILQKIKNAKGVVENFQSHPPENIGQNINNLNEVELLNSVTVPLLNTKNIFVGMVEIIFNKETVKFAEEEIRLIKGLGVSLTTAIQNYWHVIKEKNRANIERDLELASAVQDSIISKNMPKTHYYEFSEFYKTASQCGGDWYGIYDFGHERLLVLFGDVTGHGIPAALITAVARGAADMFKQIITSKPDYMTHDIPGQVLQYINDCLVETGRQTYFMTMVAALIDFKEEKILASSAGHTPPALISFHEDNTVEVKYVYPKGNSRLGFEKGTLYSSQAFDYKPGQQVVFYTDGIIESENQASKEYGLKRFKHSMEVHAHLTPEHFITSLASDAFQYYERVPPKDDIAILAIRFLTSAERANRENNTKKYSLEAA